MSTQSNSLATSTGSHLVQLTFNRIAQLEQAIRQVAETKKQLNHNALEVKASVRSAISRQMESLRNREVWLLDQVDLLQQTKDDLLRRQEDRLQRSMGGLQGTLLYCQDESVQHGLGPGIKRKLSESLENLDEYDMIPEESAELLFNSNMPTLRQAINSFGAIDCQYVPLESSESVEPVRHASPQMSSLPEGFEDYCDDEHHVLYKTVQDVKVQKTNDSSICIKIPRLAENMNPWLLPSVTLAAEDFKPTEAPTGPPSAGSSLMTGSWMKDRTPPFGVQQWLYDIQNDSNSEEDQQNQDAESFEMLTSTPQRKQEDAPTLHDPSQHDWLIQHSKAIIDTGLNTWLATKVIDSKVTDVESQLPCNIQLPVSDHVQWLKSGGSTGGPCGGSTDSSTTMTDYDFLVENVQNTDDWLMVTETGYKPMNCPVDMSLSAITQTDESKWLKSSSAPAMSVDLKLFSNMFDLSADRGCIWVHHPSCSPMESAAPTCSVLNNTEPFSAPSALQWVYRKPDSDVDSISSGLSHVSLTKCSPFSSRQSSVDRNDGDDKIGNKTDHSGYGSASKLALENPFDGSQLSDWLCSTHI